jgi:NitT/TauT family transport system permease protein
MKRGNLVLALLVLLLLWQITSSVVNLPILPAPMQVASAFLLEITGDLGLHALASLWRVLASMLIAVLIAVPAGLVLGQSPRLNRLFSPMIYLLFPTW